MYTKADSGILRFKQKSSDFGAKFWLAMIALSVGAINLYMALFGIKEGDYTARIIFLSISIVFLLSGIRIFTWKFTVIIDKDREMLSVIDGYRLFSGKVASYNLNDYNVICMKITYADTNTYNRISGGGGDFQTVNFIEVSLGYRGKFNHINANPDSYSHNKTDKLNKVQDLLLSGFKINTNNFTNKYLKAREFADKIGRWLNLSILDETSQDYHTIGNVRVKSLSKEPDVIENNIPLEKKSGITIKDDIEGRVYEYYCNFRFIIFAPFIIFAFFLIGFSIYCYANHEMLNEIKNIFAVLSDVFNDFNLIISGPLYLSRFIAAGLIITAVFSPFAFTIFITLKGLYLKEKIVITNDMFIFYPRRFIFKKSKKVQLDRLKEIKIREFGRTSLQVISDEKIIEFGIGLNKDMLFYLKSLLAGDIQRK